MLKKSPEELKNILSETLCSHDGENFHMKNTKEDKCTTGFKQFNLKKALEFYDDIYKNSGLPRGAVEGNGFTMV